MFEKKVPIFIYCVSPVHMGAGSAIGVIDNPIQRERHTEYPMIAGSGLKGAIRHDFWAQANGVKEIEDLIKKIFGPEPGSSSDYAGAISFSDAQLVAFPVRCTKNAFVYTTSETIFARVKRLLSIADVTHSWKVPKIGNDAQCLVTAPGCLNGGKLMLEAYDFTANQHPELASISEWLSENALPQDEPFEFFREKIKTDMVLLSDEDFSCFVRNATVVEPHVRIDDVSGTAVEGGLFYTENLPPETLLVSLAMASKERKEYEKNANEGGPLKAEEVMKVVLVGKTANDSKKSCFGIDGRMIQIGGDATTGRGQVFIKAVQP